MHGVYLLWWVQEKQMPPALVAAILAAGDLAVMALELPTGWFADRFGHRRSLIAGSCVQIAGMLWCWLGEGFAGLLTASVLVATGDALRSGADQALLYRSCAALGREHDFQRIEARTGAAELSALVLLTAGGGLIVTRWGFAAGWLSETLLSAIGAAIAWSMIEPPAVRRDEEPAAEAGTLRALLSGRLLALVIPVALIGSAAGATSFLAQTSVTFGPVGISILAAAIALAEAAGSAVSALVRSRGAVQQLTLACVAAVLIVATALVPGMLVASTLALSFLVGMGGPLRSAAIQRLTADHARARAASLAHAADMAVSTITLPLAGVWAGKRR